MKRSSPEQMQCSFCHKSQNAVAKLISSPSEYPRAYICDECVAVCNSIMEDDGTIAPHQHPPRPSHCLMCHPMAPALLMNVERWARSDPQQRASEIQLTEVRRMARAMMGLEDA